MRPCHIVQRAQTWLPAVAASVATAASLGHSIPCGTQYAARSRAHAVRMSAAGHVIPARCSDSLMFQVLQDCSSRAHAAFRPLSIQACLTMHVPVRSSSNRHSTARPAHGIRSCACMCVNACVCACACACASVASVRILRLRLDGHLNAGMIVQAQGRLH